MPTGPSGLPPAVGMQEKDGAKSGGEGWQMGGGRKGAALRREEEAEEWRWSLPGAGWDPGFAPVLPQAPHWWES